MSFLSFLYTAKATNSTFSIEFLSIIYLIVRLIFFLFILVQRNLKFKTLSYRHRLLTNFFASRLQQHELHGEKKYGKIKQNDLTFLWFLNYANVVAKILLVDSLFLYCMYSITKCFIVICLSHIYTQVL